MSTYSGPEIIDNGLVLAYDMLNTQKAFKGKPTTNLVITKVENYTGWTGAGWWMHPGNTTSVTTQDLPDGNIGPVLNATALSTGGLYGYNGYALGAAYVNGTQYTASFWARSYNGTPSLAVRDADSGGTLSTGVTGITSVWTRFSFTWTANASTNMLTFTGSNFSLYNVQLETNSFATPFVVGARSNTQAIVDLTGNNSITTTSLTYASNGTFSFNGSSNYIDSGPVALTGTSTQSITWACWVRPAAGAGDIINMVSGGWNMCPMWASGQVFYAKVWSNPNLTSGATFTLDQYYYLVLVRNNDTNTNSFYINGQLVASNIGAYNSSGSANNHYFGRAGAQATNTFFNGLIPKAQIYTRALTAAEVQINFNAYRGRYGL